MSRERARASQTWMDSTAQSLSETRVSGSSSRPSLKRARARKVSTREAMRRVSSSTLSTNLW